jgi:hypothetical protein
VDEAFLISFHKEEEPKEKMTINMPKRFVPKEVKEAQKLRNTHVLL